MQIYSSLLTRFPCDMSSCERTISYVDFLFPFTLDAFKYEIFRERDLINCVFVRLPVPFSQYRSLNKQAERISVLHR